jgi:hypothetical protein
MATRKEARERALRTITEVLAKHLPQEVLHAAIEEGVQSALANFKVDAYQLTPLLKAAIEERTKELLRTKYAAKIEALAEQAAADVLRKH